MKSLLLATGLLLGLGAWPSAAAEGDLEAAVPYIAGVAAAPWNFEAPPWEKAGRIPSLARMGGISMIGMSFYEEAKQPTRVYLARDREALYFAFECLDPNAKTLEPAGAGGKAKEGEGFPSGDRIEMYLEGDQGSRQGYYHLVFNVAGDRYRAIQHNRTETGNWTVRLRFLDDRWKAIVRIPYADLGLTPAQTETRGIFYRMYRPEERDGGREQSTWGGRGVHQWNELGVLKLGPLP